ncbi:MAG: phosphohydrolase [Desulfobulbus propionicus]|nr:MAG: phosphohydrolase [Desulfobulbus propionicus]
MNDESFTLDLAARLDQIRSVSHTFCLAEGGSHGPDHSERVFTTAMLLGRELGADLLILGTAALLHDIGRKEESLSKGRVCHARKGAELARKILSEHQYTPRQIQQICHCISSHRYRKGVPPSTLEAQILFDADKLDSIGAVGIGRAFLFAGQIGARLHNPEQAPEESAPYSTEDTAYREFQVKMSRIHHQMITDLGKKLAWERHQFMETFFTQLHHEIYGVEQAIKQFGTEKNA